MQEQGKNQSLGTKSIIQGHKKSKTITSPSMPHEQEKGISATQGAKHLAKHGKGSRMIYLSDAERKLDGVQYRLGDMVWAKVKSHPWWPGQLYDPSLASASAMDLKRESSFLVAFFGDSTFNWFLETELIPYEPNFTQKSGQTSAPNFVDAVEDSLDEVRRRVRSGLTCRCSASEDACESKETRDGLLYDRQLYDIRQGFEPSTLVSALKQLACSPFSFSQNILRNTVTGAQTNAFRCFVSHKRHAEHKETVGLLQRNCSKEHDYIAVETLKNRTLPEKDLLKKQPSKMPSVSKSPRVQKSSIRKQGLEEKVGGMVDELGKIKKLTKDAISKKRTIEESEECHRDRGVAKGTVLEMSIAQSGEHGAAGSNNKARTSEALDRKRGIQESTCGPEQSDACPTNVLSNKSIRSLVDHDVLTTDHEKEHIAVNTISNAVSEAESIELVVMTKESHANSKKAKVVKLEKDQAPKSNASKKVRVTDVELSQVRKKAKVAIKAKEKRSMENEPTGICREIKSQKVLPAGKGNVDDRLSDLSVDTTVSGFLPTSEVPQQTDKMITSPTSLESNLKYLQVDAAMRLETGTILSAEIPEMVLKSVQLCQEERQQPKHVDDDAMEASDIQFGSAMQKNELDENHQAVYSVHEDISPTIGEERTEKVKNADPWEHRVLPLFEGETVSDTSKKIKRTEDFSNHDSEMNGQGEEDILEIQLKSTKDEKMKDPYVSTSRIDSTVLHVNESCPVQALASSPGEKMQGVQTNTEFSIVKNGQENKRLLRESMESKQSLLSKRMPFSKKRAVEENLSMGLKAKSKKIRTVPKTVKLHADFGVEDGGKRAGLNRDGMEAIALRNMHSELMSIAAKPIDAVNEDFYPAVCRAFTNFRNVVYKKAVLQIETSDIVTTSPTALSQGLSEVGSGNNETRKLMTEQIENKAIVSNDTTGAEPSILEDARIESGGDNLISQKHSGEGSGSLQAMSTKRPITTMKPPSTSSISLRPALEAVTPVCGSKEVLNRFGQRFPRVVDTTERRMPSSFRTKSSSEGRDLVISFPYGYVLPSEKQLREVFLKFGELDVPLTRVDSKNGCAHIVFRHAKDAEAALKSMKVKPVFKNARFWLKPRDANRKQTAKLASRNVALLEKPVLSSNQLLAEPKIVTEDEGRSRITSDEGLLVHPSKNVYTSDVADKIAVSENASLATTQCGGVMHAPLPMISGNLQKSSIRASGPNQGKPNEIHAAVVAPSSVILKAGPRSLVSPITADISEPFLALLHQLHDLVLSTGFVM